MKRKILSILLCIAVCITMMPVAAYAADSTGTGENTAKKASIQLGTSGISGPITERPENDESKTYYEPTSYIYFGQNNNTSIKWRVLNANKANNGIDGMFLLSEYLLGNTNFGGTEWQGSDAQRWCSQFADNKNVFSKPERDAFLSVDKNGQEEVSFDGKSWAQSSLNKDKIFFLSASELANHVGNYADAPGMLPAKDPKQTWWLRSRKSSNSAMVGIVQVQIPDYVVNVTVGNMAQDYATRPACNLDLDQVLFTSAAEGGKPTGTIGTLATVGSNVTNEWKLTLLDSNRSGFDISNVKISGQTASFDYTGTATGENEYLSAVIVKNDTVLYYGHLLQLDGTKNLASGTATVTIPNGVNLTTDDTQLLIFNEQCNGDKKTDYASELKIVQQEITKVKVTITNPELGATPAGTDAVTFTTTPTSSVTKPEVTWYKVPKADYVDGQGSDSWEAMENDEVFKSGFCYSVSILADIPSGYVLSSDIVGSVNDKSHDATVYGPINSNNKGKEIYLRVDFDPALAVVDHQLYYNAANGNLYHSYDQTAEKFDSEYTEGKGSAWSSSQSQGKGKYDTLELRGFSFVTSKDVALKIIGMDADETFTIKETSGTLGNDNRITRGSLIAGSGVGILTNSKLTIDGGVLLAAGTQSGYAIKATGDILLKNTTLVDSLAVYKASPSPDGIHTDGTLNIENAYVRTGKITADTGIYVRECIEVHNLWVDDTVANQTDSQGQDVAKDVCAYDKNRSYFVIDGRWRVELNSNGGTWKGAQEDRVYPVTAKQLIQFPTESELPVKDGYTFSGWFTSEGTEIKVPCQYTPGTAEDENYKLSPQTGERSVGGIIPTLYAHWKSDTSGGGASGGGSTSGSSVLPATPVPKPEIQPGSGGKAELSKDGSTLEITPDEGMEIGTVTVNGKEVTVKDGKLTGLKTGDKVEITFIAKVPTKAESDKKASAKLKKLGLTVKTSKNANKNIKAIVQTDKALAAVIKELKAAGYTVKYKFYRSEKKASDYKCMLIKDTRSYLNTIGSEDTHYYYKVRLAIYDKNGKLVAQTALKQCDAGHRTWTK